MTHSISLRVGGIALVAGALANMLFWGLLLPLGSFNEAVVSLSPWWGPAQWAHLVTPVLTLLGLFALHASLAGRGGVVSLAGFIIAVVGTLSYFADAVLALIAWPVVAQAAPALLEAKGALATSPAFILFLVLFIVGYVVYGGILFVTKAAPRVPLSFWIAGAILFQLPPLVPLWVFFSGSVLWGIGAVGLGLHLWRTSAAGKEDQPGAKRFKSAWSSLIRPTEESLEA